MNSPALWHVLRNKTAIVTTTSAGKANAGKKANRLSFLVSVRLCQLRVRLTHFTSLPPLPPPPNLQSQPGSETRTPVSRFYARAVSLPARTWMHITTGSLAPFNELACSRERQWRARLTDEALPRPVYAKPRKLALTAAASMQAAGGYASMREERAMRWPACLYRVPYATKAKVCAKPAGCRWQGEVCGCSDKLHAMAAARQTRKKQQRTS